MGIEMERRNLSLVAFLLPSLLGAVFGPWIFDRGSEYRSKITEDARRIITEKGYQEWTDRETALALFYLQDERHDVLDRLLGLAIFGIIGWALKDGIEGGTTYMTSTSRNVDPPSAR